MLLGCAALTMAALVEAVPRYTVSFQGIRIAHGERIVGIDIQVGNARMVRLDEIPAGWTLTVDNDPSRSEGRPGRFNSRTAI